MSTEQELNAELPDENLTEDGAPILVYRVETGATYWVNALTIGEAIEAVLDEEVGEDVDSLSAGLCNVKYLQDAVFRQEDGDDCSMLHACWVLNKGKRGIIACSEW